MTAPQVWDILDAALEALRAGEPIETIIGRYPVHAEALAPLLRAALILETLRPVEEPTTEAVRADRTQFLASVAQYSAQAVPTSRRTGLVRMLASILAPPVRGMRPTAVVVLARAALIALVVFNLASGAVILAQDSLPGDVLYPVKLTVEEIRLGLAVDPAARAALWLARVQARSDELADIAQAGGVLDEAGLVRLQASLDQAFEQAAGLPDAKLANWLAQAQAVIKAMEQRLAAVNIAAADASRQALQQAQAMMTRAREQVEAGLRDPQTFRQRREGPAAPASTPMPQPDPATAAPASPRSPDTLTTPEAGERGHIPPTRGATDAPGGRQSDGCQGEDCRPPADATPDQRRRGQPTAQPSMAATSTPEPTAAPSRTSIPTPTRKPTITAAPQPTVTPALPPTPPPAQGHQDSPDGDTGGAAGGSGDAGGGSGSGSSGGASGGGGSSGGDGGGSKGGGGGGKKQK